MSHRTESGALRRSSSILLIAAALLAAGPARAGMAPSRGQTLLATCPDAPRLRAELTRLADSMTVAGFSAGAGDAFYWRAVSRSRAGLADSAVADFQRAVELRGAPVDQVGLADALLSRARPGDFEAVADLMQRASAAGLSDELLASRARLGWAVFLEGRADSALRIFQPVLAELDQDPVWRERVGRAAAAAHPDDARFAFDWLYPVVIATRGADREALEALRAALARDPRAHSADFVALLRGSLARVEAAERIAVETQGGRLLRWTALDGFPISAALFAGERRRPVALVMLAPGDSLAGCDSLVSALSRSGLATLLVERRGTRGAAGSGCALASDFYGREEALEALIARDALEALRHAAHEAPLDTTWVLVSGLRAAAPTAVLAATLLPRAKALLLVSPEVAETDLGLTCARLAKLQRPMFIQLAPEDYDVVIPADALYQSGARATSRVAQSRAPGRGAEQFRGDPSIAPRFARWFAEALKAPTSRATRRSPRPRG